MKTSMKISSSLKRRLSVQLASEIYGICLTTIAHCPVFAPPCMKQVIAAGLLFTVYMTSTVKLMRYSAYSTDNNDVKCRNVIIIPFCPIMTFWCPVTDISKITRSKKLENKRPSIEIRPTTLA